MKNTDKSTGIIYSSVKRTELTMNEVRDIFNLAVAYSDDAAEQYGLFNLLGCVKRVNDARDKDYSEPLTSNYRAHEEVCLKAFNEGVKYKHIGINSWKEDLAARLNEKFDYDLFFILCYATGLEKVMAETALQRRIDTPKIKRLICKGLLVQSVKNPDYLQFSKSANMKMVMALFPNENDSAVMSELSESQCIINASGNLFTANLMWQFLDRRNNAKPTKEKASSTRMAEMNRKKPGS